MRADVANSKCIVVGINVAVDGARPGLGEHIGGSLRPRVVVRRLAMRGVAGLVAVDLDQLEPRGVGGLLDHVEAYAARFLEAAAGILDGCFYELIDMLGLYPDVDVKMYINVFYGLGSNSRMAATRELTAAGGNRCSAALIVAPSDRCCRAKSALYRCYDNSRWIG